MEEQVNYSVNGDGATSASEWRKPREKGYLLTLPSGLRARLRPVSIPALMAQGQIPDLLSPIAAQTVWAGPESFLPDDMEGIENIKDPAEQKQKLLQWIEQMADNAPKLLLMQDIVVRAAFVEPHIVPKDFDGDLGPNDITIEDVDDLDKAQVYQICTRGAAALKFFRDGQTRDVQPVSDGEDVVHSSERPNGRTGRMGHMDGADVRQRSDAVGDGSGERSPGDDQAGAG